MEGIVKDVITSQYDVWLVTRNKFVDVAMVVKQRVPPESYYFKELHFDGISLMVVDQLPATWWG